MLLRFLTVSTTSTDAEHLAALLGSPTVRARSVGPDDDLWAALRREPADALAIDARCIEGSPADFVAAVRALPEAPEVVVFARSSAPEERAALQAAHAFAVVDRAAATVKDALAGVVARLAGKVRLQAEQVKERSSLGDFASRSPRMRGFLEFVRKVVDSDSTLLLLGETGVGKEYLSRAIHSDGPRSKGPFVPVNCAALSESLLESELFGHVEGAFTGAHRGRKGYFEMAHGGTLFVDEVGELRPQTQVKLLRALQDKRVQPVGAEEEIEIDVRLIAATNRDLMAEVEAGRFRSDLFYRLGVVRVEVPPLRERKEDIPGLFESHVENFHFTMNRPVRYVGDDAMALLVDYPWPGNVRELINVAERAVLLCGGDTVTPADLPEEIRGGPSPLDDGPPPPAPALPTEAEPSVELRPFKQARREVLDAFERRYIESVLARCRGRVHDAARSSGIHPRSLYEKMRRLGIRKESFKLP